MRELTKKEKRAISRLTKLAADWPQTLTLFSWSSNLTIYVPDDQNRVVAHIYGIPNDGGDPSSLVDVDGNVFVDLE